MITSDFRKAHRSRVLLAFAIVLLLALLPATALAADGDTPPATALTADGDTPPATALTADGDTPPATALTADGDTPPAPFIAGIEANATVEIPIYAFCLNYTWPFPGQSLSSVELAPDNVRTAIGYISQKGYVTTDPWQAQLAVWYFTEGGKVAETYEAVADEIIAYVEGGAPVPDAGVPEIPLHQAVADGIVSASIDDFTNISPPGFAFLGSGTLVITNLTDQPVKILIPFGTRFEDPSNSETQTMGVFPQPTAEPPTLPPTGGFLAPELAAALGLAGLGGGWWMLRRGRRAA